MEPGPTPKNATNETVIITEIRFQALVCLTIIDIKSIVTVTNIPPRPVICRIRRPRRSIRKTLITVAIMFAAPILKLIYSDVS